MAKKQKRSQSEKRADSKRRRATSLFPKNSLKDALRIPETIRDQNAGKPFSRITLAKALDLSPGGSNLRSLIISANKYGLIEGNYASESVGTSELGKSIVYPRTDEEQKTGLKTALYNIELFKEFFENFNGNRAPRKDLLLNTLNRDYNIPVQDTEACHEMLMRNARDLGILTTVKGAEYVEVSRLSVAKVEETEEQEIKEEIEEKAERLERKSDQELKAPETKPPTEWQAKVFIAHSKNKKILEQIKQILDFGQFKYAIAEEVQTTSIPIPEKIFGLMKQCNSGIINVSADEQERLPDGTYKINQDVLIEIGGAFLRYDKRVILLVDKRLTLPSNLQGLYRCEYEGDELSFSTAMNLQNSLKEFRKPGAK